MIDRILPSCVHRHQAREEAVPASRAAGCPFRAYHRAQLLNAIGVQLAREDVERFGSRLQQLGRVDGRNAVEFEFPEDDLLVQMFDPPGHGAREIVANFGAFQQRDREVVLIYYSSITGEYSSTDDFERLAGGAGAYWKPASMDPSRSGQRAQLR